MLHFQTNVKPTFFDLSAKPRDGSRLTVKQLLAAYCRMTPAQRVHFGREIGINRVWQPKPRQQRSK